MSLRFRAAQFVCIFQVKLLTFYKKHFPHCSHTRFVTLLSMSAGMLTAQILLHLSTAACSQGMPGHCSTPLSLSCLSQLVHTIAIVLDNMGLPIFWFLICYFSFILFYFSCVGLERSWKVMDKIDVRQLAARTFGEIPGPNFFNLHWLSCLRMVGEKALYTAWC